MQGNRRISSSQLSRCRFAQLELQPSSSRSVNISNTWFLPEEGFPVFYRYFRDRITWFEADAVCQFHHANLVTVDNSVQFDTTRAYLKELDVVTNVWIGLKKSDAKDKWAWTDYKPLAPDGGYWLEQSAKTEGSLCAAIDPAADFRWHSLNCGGPEVASFICELPVPPWARQEDGCMLTALPSLTVTFLPEQAAVELTSDCGLDGTRRIACKGQANHDEMMRQLSCDNVDANQEDEDNTSSSITSASTSAASVSASSTPGTTAEPPTRHRRDADDVASSSSSLLIANTMAVSEESLATTSSYDTPLSTQNPKEHNTSPFLADTSLPSSTAASTTAQVEIIDSQHVDLTMNQQLIDSDNGMNAIELTQLDKDIIFNSNIPSTSLPAIVSSQQSLITPLSSGSPVTSTNSGLPINAVNSSSSNYSTEVNLTNVTDEINIREKTPLATTTMVLSTAENSQNTSMSVSTSTTSNSSIEETRRRQLLPTPLRGEINTTTRAPMLDWVPVAQEQEEAMEEEPEEPVEPLEPEPEIPARPNRGRRLTRPQGHSFYPYFLNRVLG
ncbi:serine-rich adhesin for platelets [Anabrus simplex]|uniref:serine-rich adhesin for platelets n=1 Tax=Anabrus simplex TaxID=316456 RepID=UPI0035A272D2